MAQAVIAILEDFVDVLGHAFADAGKGGEFLAIFGEVFDALGDAVDQVGGAFVAAIAADDGAIDFEEMGGVAEDFGDFAIFHAGIIWELDGELQGRASAELKRSRTAGGLKTGRV